MDKHLISVQPEELKFRFELDKLSCCDLKVTNNTEHHVVFKVKTTSPKKYFVRPNIGVMHPWDSCVIRVTLQAQREYPPNMQCRDKFLLQSTIVPPNTTVDDLPEDTFSKEVGSAMQEYKLKVFYITPHSTRGNLDTDSNEGLQRLREERDAAIKQKQQLQEQLELCKRRRKSKSGSFSLKFAVVVGVIGISMGFILNLLLSSTE